MACDSWETKRDQGADHSLSEVISSTNLVSSLRFGGMSPASRTLISAATKTYYSLLSAILDSLYQNFHKARPRWNGIKTPLSWVTPSSGSLNAHNEGINSGFCTGKFGQCSQPVLGWLPIKSTICLEAPPIPRAWPGGNSKHEMRAQHDPPWSDVCKWNF